MAQAESRAQKTLRRIGVARANLAFLQQKEARKLDSILRRYATEYRLPPNGMTRARTLDIATTGDCAAALVKSLDQLVADASFIRGINRTDSSVLNVHLQVLGGECEAFTLVQAVDEPSVENIGAAVERFSQRGLGDGTFAGSALG